MQLAVYFHRGLTPLEPNLILNPEKQTERGTSYPGHCSSIKQKPEDNKGQLPGVLHNGRHHLSQLARPVSYDSHMGSVPFGEGK